MRLSRIDMVESMRLDRINGPAVAPVPHILCTGSSVASNWMVTK